MMSKDTLTSFNDNMTIIQRTHDVLNAITLKTNRFSNPVNIDDFYQVIVKSKVGKLNLHALLDTGALHGDYISLEVKKHVEMLGF